MFIVFIAASCAPSSTISRMSPVDVFNQTEPIDASDSHVSEIFSPDATSSATCG